MVLSISSTPMKLPALRILPELCLKENSVFARCEQLMTMMVLFACGACAQKNDEWSNIDYSKVYKAAGERRDIDSGYKAPSVIGCVDDDLFNCK